MEPSFVVKVHRSSTRFAPLDGLRALAISLVLVAHTVQDRVGDALGSLGVNIFFVLSGYLISSLLVAEWKRTGRIDLPAFYRRRMWRIFPAYYVFLACIAIASLAGLTNVDLRAFAYDVLYLRNYAFNVPFDWWTGHSWTLCVEQQFYIVWPFVLVFAGLLGARRFAFACLVGAPLLRVAIYLTIPGARDFIDIMLPTRIDMLMFGCAYVVATLGDTTLSAWLTERRLAALTACIWAAVIAGIGLTVRYHGLYALTVGYSITGVAVISLIVYMVRYPQCGAARVLSIAPVTWLGRISYSLYLWQQPFLTPGLNHTMSGRFPFNLISAVVVATLSYYLIERGFLVRRLSDKGSPLLASERG